MLAAERVFTAALGRAICARVASGESLMGCAAPRRKPSGPAGLQFDVMRWQAVRIAPRKYCERLVVADGLAQAAQAAGTGGPLTVVIRRFTDAPDPEAGEYPEPD
jgi:hypothetical protein